MSVLLGLIVTAALAAAPAHASCGASIMVEGQELYPTRVADPHRLPPTAGSYPARRCGASGDTGIAVRRLRGLAPELAVLSLDRRRLYVARDTHPAVPGHPLRAALAGGGLEPRPAGCRRQPRERAAVVVEERPGGFHADLGDSRADVVVDARTRFANLPAYIPIRRGQRLRLRMSTCKSRRFADTVSFTGPVPALQPADGGPFADPNPTAMIGGSLLLALIVGAGLLGPRVLRRRSG